MSHADLKVGMGGHFEVLGGCEGFAPCKLDAKVYLLLPSFTCQERFWLRWDALLSKAL